MAVVAHPSIETDATPPGLLAWLTAVDHKRIGKLYLTAAFAFFLIGGMQAEAMRAELMVPGLQLTDSEGYSQLFTMHGTIMLLLFATPAAAALANFLVPLQIGAADMVFPRLNALSFWLFLLGGLIILSGYAAVGGPADVGWTGYPPNSTLHYSTTSGTDLWIVGLIVTGVGSILGSINFMATILTARAPGMSMFRLPLFTWNILVMAVLIVFSFPALTGALIMLLGDRRFGTSFFLPGGGGDPILWQHVFWFFGHPEVYVVALPFFGVISEIIPVFSRKPLFGYRFVVFATILIGAFSFSVWAHHMFTTGAISVPFFSIATFIIAVPTGIKFFNWMATMWRGSLSFETPMLWAIGFLYVFLFGGITGVILGSAPIDYALQDTYYVVAHLHNVLIGGSVFALFGAIYFWFPKMTGRRLSERLGRVHFACWVVGFTLTFLPQYELGALGMPRRYADYPADAGWTQLNQLSTIGSLLMAVGTLPFLAAVVLALRRPPDQPPDPWGGNSLEWATTSPPPEHNFERIPPIRSERPVFDARQAAAVAAAGAAVAGAAVAGAAGRGGAMDRSATGRGARGRGFGGRTRPAAGPMSRASHLLGLDEPQETKFFLVIAGWGLVVGVIYWFVSYEPAGTVLLIGLGVASGLAAARLIVVNRGVVRRRAGPAAEAEVALADEATQSGAGTGGIDRPFAATGRIPDPTVAPLAVGLGVALVATGAVFGVAPVALGVVPLVWGALLWLGAAGDELEATRELDAIETSRGPDTSASGRGDRAGSSRRSP